MSSQLRLFRRLVRVLFPEDFRSDYESEMTRTFGAQHRDAAGGGMRAVLRLWLETIAGFARTAPREHLAQLRQDVAYTLRLMRRTPGFTAVALITLATGIGANTAVFTIFNAVMLRPLPYGAPSSLVMVWNHWPGTDRGTLSTPELLDFRERLRSLDLGAFGAASATLIGHGDPQQLRTAVVTPNLLDVLGVRPLLGRTFRSDEEQRGRHQVAILTHELWRDVFNSDRQVTGQTITLNRVPYIVVGVLPQDFVMPHDFAAEQRTAVLMPFALDVGAPRHERGSHYLRTVARLRPGHSYEQAQAEVAGIGRAFDRENPGEYNAGYGATARPLESEIVGDVRVAMFVLLGAVGLVLLIACANVANLLLARAQARSREIAVRKAIGASHARLVRQVLTESLVLAAAGAVAGVALAQVLTTVIVGAASGIPRVDEVGLDPSVLGFTVVVSVLTALVFGSLPASDLAHRDVNAGVMTERTSRSPVRGAVRSALVIAQVALAIVLLVGAGLLIQSFSRLLRTPAGINTDRLLTFRVGLPTRGYVERDRVVAFYDQLVERLRAQPDVRAAGAAMNLPLANPIGDWDFYLTGETPGPHGSERPADWQVVTPGYLEAVGVPLLRGRFPRAADDGRSAAVVVINDVMARTYFSGIDPIGRQIRMSSGERPWMTIIGVSGSVRHNGLDTPANAQLYIPHAQFTPFWSDTTVRSMAVVARTTGEPLALAPAARALVRELDSTVPVSQVKTMEGVVERAVAPRRLNMMLLAFFAAIALLLAVVGTYSVMAFHVTERTREFGVRMAIGARAGDILRMVLRQGMSPAIVGVFIGLGGAALATRLLSALLFETEPLDVATFAATAGILLTAALAACCVPARRATRVDPSTALRVE